MIRKNYNRSRDSDRTIHICFQQAAATIIGAHLVIRSELKLAIVNFRCIMCDFCIIKQQEYLMWILP